MVSSLTRMTPKATVSGTKAHDGWLSEVRFIYNPQSYNITQDETPNIRSKFETFIPFTEQLYSQFSSDRK